MCTVGQIVTERKLYPKQNKNLHLHTQPVIKIFAQITSNCHSTKATTHKLYTQNSAEKLKRTAKYIQLIREDETGSKLIEVSRRVSSDLSQNSTDLWKTTDELIQHRFKIFPCTLKTLNSKSLYWNKEKQ